MMLRTQSRNRTAEAKKFTVQWKTIDPTSKEEKEISAERSFIKDVKISD